MCIHPQCFYGRRCHSWLSHLTECLASTTIFIDSNHLDHHHRHDADWTDERNSHFQEEEEQRSRFKILSSRIFDEHFVDHDDVRSEIQSPTRHTDAVGQQSIRLAYSMALGELSLRIGLNMDR